jgi:pyridoxal biosynthesis lyase PdxS
VFEHIKEELNMVRNGTDRVKRGMAEMQKGGVIMDVINAEQAKIAEAAGAVAVMAFQLIFVQRAACLVWQTQQLLKK